MRPAQFPGSGASLGSSGTTEYLVTVVDEQPRLEVSACAAGDHNRHANRGRGSDSRTPAPSTISVLSSAVPPLGSAMLSSPLARYRKMFSNSAGRPRPASACGPADCPGGRCPGASRLGRCCTEERIWNTAIREAPRAESRQQHVRHHLVVVLLLVQGRGLVLELGPDRVGCLGRGRRAASERLRGHHQLLLELREPRDVVVEPCPSAGDSRRFRIRSDRSSGARGR